MSKKCGVCESCNKQKLLYEIKKEDLTTGEIVETVHWWCSDCFHRHLDRLKTHYWKNNDEQ